MDPTCYQNLKILCYVCGLFTPKSKQKELSSDICDNYYESFHQVVLIERYTPNKICYNCYTMLWEERKHRVTPVTPMMWLEPNSDHSNCYACLIPNLTKYTWKRRKNPKYPSFPVTNSLRPVWPSQEVENGINSCSFEPQPGTSNVSFDSSMFCRNTILMFCLFVPVDTQHAA